MYWSGVPQSDHMIFWRSGNPIPGRALGSADMTDSAGRLGWFMPIFASYDGTEIGYRVLGDGPPLVCLPGGPGRAAEYLGDLGGVSVSRQLVLLDPRGVGLSADPADPATLRVDLLVRDVDALRGPSGPGAHRSLGSLGRGCPRDAVRGGIS